MERIDHVLAALYTEFTLTGNTEGMLKDELLQVLPGFKPGHIEAMRTAGPFRFDDGDRVSMVKRGWDNAYNQGLSACVPLLSRVERAVWEHLINKAEGKNSGAGRADIAELAELVAPLGGGTGHVLAVVGKPVSSVRLALEGSWVVAVSDDLDHLMRSDTSLDNLLGWSDRMSRSAEVVALGKRVCELRSLPESSLGLEAVFVPSTEGTTKPEEFGRETMGARAATPAEIRSRVLREAYERFMESEKLNGFLDPIEILADEFDQMELDHEIEYLVETGLLSGTATVGLGRPSWRVHVTDRGLLDVESCSGEGGLPEQLGREADERRIHILEWFESQRGWAAQRNMPDRLAGDPLFRHDIWFLDEAGYIEAHNARNVVAEVHAKITAEGRIMLEQIRTRHVKELPWKPTPWAFISSPRGEMENLRDRARDGAIRARALPVGMESWGAKARPSINTCFDELDRCDVMILVIGHRYGSQPRGSDKAYTELEYEKAVERGIPVLAFVSKSTTVDMQKVDPDDLARLQAFKKRLQDAEQQMFAQFHSDDELEKLVHQSLREWQDEEGGQQNSGASQQTISPATDRGAAGSVSHKERPLQEMWATVDDEFEARFHYDLLEEHSHDVLQNPHSTTTLHWREVFHAFAARLIMGAQSGQLKDVLAKQIAGTSEWLKIHGEHPPRLIRGPHPERDCHDSLIRDLHNWKLIRRSESSGPGEEAVWLLTELGDEVQRRIAEEMKGSK
jgi:hypothetical protein